ncbi:MAG: DNA primase catalytic subunit PriS [Halobacteriota archaeon]|nr:DNA primase catalytic subunit PriS [Halobacteriota archaeon]
MNERTKSYIRSRFREYYQNATLKMPPELDKREWGFIFFDRSYPDITMRRHKYFASEASIISYLREMAPAHTYYSSALYTYPGASSMNAKEWLGADLIFDLDADHLRRKADSYSGMLEMVKKETLKLIDFLIADFGFGADDMEIVFSGGRGYHVHITDPRVRSLGSGERREIIDYLRGTGLDYDRFLIEESVKGETGRRTKSLKISHDGGWGKKIHESVIDLLEMISGMEKEDVFEELAGMGITDKKEARKIIKLSNKEMKEEIKRGFVGFKGFPRGFWENLIDVLKLDIGGESDEPVTSDIKRLIRFPTSIHGGSSLQVTPLKMDQMDDFDPLSDAVIFGDDSTSVKVTKPCEIFIRGENFKLSEGEETLPEYAAVFLMCRGMGEFGPRK